MILIIIYVMFLNLLLEYVFEALNAVLGQKESFARGKLIIKRNDGIK